jgi:hypothetical protein
MVLAAFFLLQAGRLSGTGFVYQVLNLLGGWRSAGVAAGEVQPSVFFLEGWPWMRHQAATASRFRSRLAEPHHRLDQPSGRSIIQRIA